MENNKLGQEPAFPEVVLDSYSGKPSGQEHGISKRFYAACAAMNGILSNEPWLNNLTKISDSMKEFNSKVIKISYEIADELLKQENE